MAGFKGLSEKEQKLFPNVMSSHPDHEYFIKSIFGKFAVQMSAWFERIFTAQKCWDIIMAESMLRILKNPEYRDYKAVIIAGSAHVAYYLGIPFRLQSREKDLPTTTIIPVYLPEKDDEEELEGHPMMKVMSAGLKPVATFSRGIGDYVFSVPELPVPHFPVLGFKGKMENNTYLITEIEKESLSERFGIKKGDRLLHLDGKAVVSKEQLRSLLADKNWDDELTVEIRRKIKIEK
jgi:hypothetical protein